MYVEFTLCFSSIRAQLVLHLMFSCCSSFKVEDAAGTTAFSSAVTVGTSDDIRFVVVQLILILGFGIADSSDHVAASIST